MHRATVGGGEFAMLTYEECVAFSDLPQEVIEAIACHEHVPEIAALEQGSCLCATQQGREAIGRMIIEDCETALARGNVQAAARMGLVLYHFIDAHKGVQHPLKIWYQAGITPSPEVREHVDAYLRVMLAHFKIDPDIALGTIQPVMQIAQRCCVECKEKGRCRQFLEGITDADDPRGFCPNAPLFDEISQRLHDAPTQ
jgi:hypothetical protein